jgi:pentatricopeptide repeat protein
VFDSMAAAGVEANVFTYSALISAMEKGGQWEQAQRVFDGMVAAGMQPNVATYGALITAMEKGGQWEQAQRVFDSMAAAGVEPSDVTYSALISALEQAGQWEQALRMFDGMWAAGVEPSEITYSALIGALGKGGEWDRALRVFGDMLAAGECAAKLSDVPPSGGQDGAARACTVDLHGCRTPEAATAVAFVLRAIQRAAPAKGRLSIITGRGLHSEQALQPVLRPQVCAMLDALAPPLRWSLADGNDGCVEVSARDLGEWCAASGDDWVAHLRPLGQ